MSGSSMSSSSISGSSMSGFNSTGCSTMCIETNNTTPKLKKLGNYMTIKY
jgi:hypothetical protein